MSLPTDLSKPLPPRPGSRTPEALKDLPPIPVRCGSAEVLDAGTVDALPPSLSRRAAGANATAPHTGAKKLFNLADEADFSEDEDVAQRGYKGQPKVAHEEQGSDRATDQVLMREQRKQKAETLRRYHALSELLATEVGYLLDLRALVTVRRSSRRPDVPLTSPQIYLDQLLLLCSPPLTPASVGLSSPGNSAVSSAPFTFQPARPLSTFSALSIPSLFPCSRTSVLASPYPSPLTSGPDNLWGTSSDGSSSSSRERQPSGSSSDSSSREEKENLSRIFPLKTAQISPGPIMIEREVRTVCRNAQELLEFHERFVDELRTAVSSAGFQEDLSPEGDGWSRKGGEEAVIEEIEHAIEVVAEKFVHEVSVRVHFPLDHMLSPRRFHAFSRLRPSPSMRSSALDIRLQWTWCAVRRTGGQRCGTRTSSAVPC